jgi:hypothetical protein
MMKWGVCIGCCFSLLAVSQAVVLEFEGIQAHQHLRRVFDLDAEQSNGSMARFVQQRGDLASGPIQSASGLKRYRWELHQQVDVDGDGLQDVVRVLFSLRGSAPLHQPLPGHFSVGDHVGLPKGSQLKIEVESVSYTLATGASGPGLFKSFTAVELAEPAAVRLNGKEFASRERVHAVDLDALELRIEPTAKGGALPAIASFSFRIEADTDLAGGRKAELSARQLIACFAPALLLLLRKPRETAKAV